MSLIHQAGRIINHTMRGLMQRGEMDTACITILHDTSAAPADPNVQAGYPEQTTGRMEVKAFVHFVRMLNSMRSWTTVKVGDVVLGLLPEDAKQIKELRGVTIELPDGDKYQQAEDGGELQPFWDMHIGGECTLQTVLLRKIP